MATWKSSLTVGALIRGQVRRQIKRYAFDRGYSIRIDEDKGFLDSTMYVTIGDIPESSLASVGRDIQSWMRAVNS